MIKSFLISMFGVWFILLLFFTWVGLSSDIAVWPSLFLSLGVVVYPAFKWPGFWSRIGTSKANKKEGFFDNRRTIQGKPCKNDACGFMNGHTAYKCKRCGTFLGM